MLAPAESPFQWSQLRQTRLTVRSSLCAGPAVMPLPSNRCLWPRRSRIAFLIAKVTCTFPSANATVTSRCRQNGLPSRSNRARISSVDLLRPTIDPPVMVIKLTRIITQSHCISDDALRLSGWIKLSPITDHPQPVSMPELFDSACEPVRHPCHRSHARASFIITSRGYSRHHTAARQMGWCLYFSAPRW